MCNWLNRCVVLLIFCIFSLCNIASAAIIDVIYVGTWDSTSNYNDDNFGSGISPEIVYGQKYVISISYDDLSAETNNVALFGGEQVTTVNLQAGLNSLDVYVPMAAYDAGTPFIYTQTETDHFPAFVPMPTLNFVNGSDISDKSNIVGLEFEGDFAGAGQNFIELYNYSSGGDIFMSSTIVELNEGVMSTDTNLNSPGLVEAVELVVDAGPDIVYNAASLIQTATASMTQSNDLGAARSDGEDFVDVTWSPAGTVTGNSNEVGIVDSGLTMTTSTTTWQVDATEQMTGKSDSDTTNVSYANAIPTLNGSATANGTDIDFILNANDADLAVNGLITGFEMLSFTASVNGAIDATAYFANLFDLGSFSYSMADLVAEFGDANHNVLFTAMDKAGDMATAAFDFDVTGTTNPTTIPEPSALLLMCLGLLLLWRRQHKDAL
jgi:hypothetical protein